MKDFDLSAFLADLRTLCAIDSGHFNAPGTAAVADFFESRYRALGLKTERRYYDNNDFAPFLTARNSEDEQIDVLFVAHMDTVFPVGTGAQWPLEVDADGLAHGPGCIDCKGGCLSLYYLLRQMLQAGDCRFRFCVAMNSDEERGSAYSRPYFEALAQKSRYCFVFEPGRPNEEFVSQRKGGANYIFKCHGISAHSGVEPEKGASAILELSRWVNELYKLNDFAAGTTVNVGRFDGGGDNGGGDNGNGTDPNNPGGKDPNGNDPDGNNPDGSHPDGNNPDGNNPDGSKSNTPKTGDTRLIWLVIALAVIFVATFAATYYNRRKSKHHGA